MLQSIATAREELDHAPASSNTQGSHGVKVGGQDHDSGGPYLPLSKKPSSLRPHQDSDKRRGGMTSNSRSEPSSNNDGGLGTMTEGLVLPAREITRQKQPHSHRLPAGFVQKLISRSRIRLPLPTMNGKLRLCH